jgi:hypothetical protein
MKNVLHTTQCAAYTLQYPEAAGREELSKLQM